MSVDAARKNACATMLFAEDADFYIFVVYVHGEFVQLVDEFFQILRINLAQIEGHAMIVQRGVYVLAGLEWD